MKNSIYYKAIFILVASLYCLLGGTALAQQEGGADSVTIDVITASETPTQTPAETPIPTPVATGSKTEAPVVTATATPAASPTPSPTPEPAQGWNQQADGNWKYFKDGKFVKSDWVTENNRWYYLDAEGNMCRGWLKLGGRAYYLSASGVMQTGTVAIGGQNEEFSSAGRYIGPKRGSGYTGWAKGGPDGNWYYIRKGKITRGWQQVSGNWFLLKSDGVMASNEWARSGSKWCYMNASGHISQGWKKIEDNWYYFTPGSGIMKTGWFKSGETWYYLRGDGTMVDDGWIVVGRNWYYFNPGGRMATGWKKLDEDWYYLKAGIMQTGWMEQGGNWYYLKGNGTMVDDTFHKIGSRWYYFAKGGRMAKGWKQVEENWYYLKSESGIMQTGWQKLGNQWYYLRGDGSMVTGFIRIGANWYYFTGSGVMEKGWTKVDSKWYYFKTDGVMASGKYRIGSKDYYFTVDGEWIDYGNVSKGIDVSSWQSNINWKSVKDSGMADFVLIRALRCEPTAGPGGTPRYSIDPTFETNVRQAKSHGIKIGAYLVTYAFNNDDMRKEVEMFVNSAEVKRLRAEGIRFDFPVFIDIEYNGILTGNPSYESRTNVLRYGMDLLRQHGYKPGFYSNMNWANNYYNAAQLSNEGYYFWLARYPGDPYQKPENKPSSSSLKGALFAIWQYTSSGVIDGISGSVDMNFGYTNF